MQREKMLTSENGHSGNNISKRMAILTIALFLIILLLIYIDINLFPPYLDTLITYFDYTIYTPLTIITAIITILSGISTVICGYYADKSSRKKILFFGTLTYAIMAMCTIMIPEGRLGYAFFFITRAFVGIGIGAIIPSIFSIVSDIVASDRRATIMAYLTAIMFIGQTAGNIIGESIITSGEKWQYGYFYSGLIAFFVAISLKILVKEPKRGMGDVELKIALEGAEYRFQISREDLKILKKNKSNVWLIINFVDTFPGAIIALFIFSYFEAEHNLKGDLINMTIGLVGIGGLIGTILFGYLGDKFFKKDKRARVKIALFCNAAPILFFIIILNTSFWIPEGANIEEALMIPGVWILILSIIIAIFINQGVGGNWYSSVIDVNLPEHRATMISLASAMDLIGRALGPLIAGLIADHLSLKMGMYSALIFWVLNILFWIPILKNIDADLENIHNILTERAKNLTK